MIQPHVKRVLVESPNRYVREVGLGRLVDSVCGWVQLDHLSANRVKEIRRNLVAWSPGGLGAIGRSQNWIAGIVAVEARRVAGCPRTHRIRIHEVRKRRTGSARISQRIQREV